MATWIGNKAFANHPVPGAVESVMSALGDLSKLPGLRSADGGIRREDVLVAMASRCQAAGLVPTPDAHTDGSDPTHRIGLRVEAGRAHTNNDGLLAVLEAAANPDVDVLVLVVPAFYKGSVTADRVEQRIRWAFSSPGIEVALTGVALLSY